MKSTYRKFSRFVALIAVGVIAAMGAAHADGWRSDDEQLAQMTELEQLHATFHAAVSVHDPVNGDSPAVITQRIREALSIWSRDAQLTVVGTTATAGNYAGNGDPGDPDNLPSTHGRHLCHGATGHAVHVFQVCFRGAAASQ